MDRIQKLDPSASLGHTEPLHTPRPSMHRPPCLTLPPLGKLLLRRPLRPVAFPPLWPSCMALSYVAPYLNILVFPVGDFSPGQTLTSSRAGIVSYNLFLHLASIRRSSINPCGINEQTSTTSTDMDLVQLTRGRDHISEGNLCKAVCCRGTEDFDSSFAPSPQNLFIFVLPFLSLLTPRQTGSTHTLLVSSCSHKRVFPLPGTRLFKN